MPIPYEAAFRAVPGLTPGMARALDLLLAAEAARAEAAGDEDDLPEAEIVCDGLACWIGTDRTTYPVLHRLLAGMLVGAASDEGGVRRYALTEVGRVARRRPEIVAEVLAALARGDAFEVRDDRVVALAPSTIP